MGPLNRHLNKWLEEVAQATERAMEDIRDLTVREIVDNRNWNPLAVYKRGPQRGQRYDLEDSGRLMQTIKDPNLNKVVRQGSQITAGIGSIPDLDALRSERSGNVPYWRLVVFGRDPIPGYVFVKTGAYRGKVRGYAMKVDDGKIERSEPTYMFENGLKRAKKMYSGILAKRYLESGVVKRQ